MGVATVTGGISNAQEIADKMAALKRPVVIWLQLQECTGCLESTIRSYNEEIGDMVLSAVSMPYVELLMAPSGEAANQALEDAIREPHILVINGSVPVNDGGVYCTVAGDTVENMLRHCAENASHILAVGSCAYFGSIQAARPNPHRGRGHPGHPDGPHGHQRARLPAHRGRDYGRHHVHPYI